MINFVLIFLSKNCIDWNNQCSFLTMEESEYNGGLNARNVSKIAAGDVLREAEFI